VKYLLISSKVAEHPPLLADTTAAPTLILLSAVMLYKRRSIKDTSVPFADAKYTGDPITIPLAIYVQP